MTPKQQRRRWRYLPILLISIGVSGLGVGAFALVRVILNSTPATPKKVVQEVHLIRPPPPPPETPPPPPPPPEEKVEVHEQEQQPDPTPTNEPPPSEHLGLDAEGGAGGDAFGLVGNKGGRDLIGGSGGNAFAWYSGLIQGEVRDCLADDKSVRGSIRLSMWVRADGSIDRVRLTESTGDQRRDKAIETKLEGCRRFSQAPPAGTPQPINLRLVSHG